MGSYPQAGARLLVTGSGHGSAWAMDLRPLLIGGLVPARLLPPFEPPAVHPVLPFSDLALADPDEVDLPAGLQHLVAGMVTGIVEALAGRRSPLQLEGWLEPELVSLLEHLCRARVGHGLRLRSVRLHTPLPGVVEAVAGVEHRGGTRVVAYRAELRAGRWRGTRLELSLQPPVVNRAASRRLDTLGG